MVFALANYGLTPPPPHQRNPHQSITIETWLMGRKERKTKKETEREREVETHRESPSSECPTQANKGWLDGWARLKQKPAAALPDDTDASSVSTFSLLR